MNENKTQKLSMLFEQLSVINQKYKALEHAQASAFNVFTILRDKGEEVGLHSRFIAELLDTEGSHQRNVFQKLFIQHVINNTLGTGDDDWQRECIPENEIFSCKYEVGVGVNGRIDICLRSKNYVIVIENKIYAEDQKNQLERYFNAAQNWRVKDENIYVLYLTLHGDDVSTYGRGNLDTKNYGCISYETNIKNWLDLCAQAVYDVPNIRETIIQYKRLTERLTGQTQAQEHTMDIIKLLEKDQNFEAALQLSRALPKFQKEVQFNAWTELQASLAEKGFEFSFVNNNFERSYTRNEFKTELVDNYYGSRNARCYGLQYQIGNYYAADKAYGIHLYVEVDYRLYFGLTASLDKIRNKYVKELNQLKESVSPMFSELQESKHFENPNSEWFLGGIVLPSSAINFKEIDNNFSILINPEKRKEWIEKTSCQIVELIQLLKLNAEALRINLA